MSIASQKGKHFEQVVAKMIRSKLSARIVRDRRSGAGTNKADISDYFMELPLSIECKDQDTVKIKEWFIQADAASSFNQVPTVVFHADSEILATLRFSDLLNFLVEIADQKAQIDDLRTPVMANESPILTESSSHILKAENLQPAAKLTPNLEPLKYCPNGHIADEFGYCEQKDCKFRRGYKAIKAKRSK